VGEAYLGHGQYQSAITSFTKALTKGSIKNKDEVNLNLGIAYLRLNKNEEAIKAFKAVPASSKLALMSRLWVIQASTKKV